MESGGEHHPGKESLCLHGASGKLGPRDLTSLLKYLPLFGIHLSFLYLNLKLPPCLTLRQPKVKWLVPTFRQKGRWTISS